MRREPSLKERIDKPTLEALYNRAGLSTVEIAERFGTRPAYVLRLMDDYGISRRLRRARK